jgi:ABC-type cobalamin/Fe3+-siderophores transport system ATPase subunit
MTTRQGILITDFMLSDERKITLAHNTIVVITGPNNVGKTTLLQEINRFFRRSGGVNFKGRILRSANYKSNGNVDKFIDLMKVEANYDEEDDVITVIGGRYKIETLRKAFFENNLPKAVQEQFVESLDPRERIGGYYNRKDPVELAADALFFDEETETRISKSRIRN